MLRLRTEYPDVVDLPRLDLALQTLQQPAGREAIRVAILGLADSSETKQSSARELLRVLLSDPLGDEAQWETELADMPPGEPLVVRIRSRQHPDSTLHVDRQGSMRTIEVSSPGLDDANLELVLMDVQFPTGYLGSPAGDITAALTPTVVQAALSTSLSVPVHSAIVVGESLKDAIKLISLSDSAVGSEGLVRCAINSKGLCEAKAALDSEVSVIDVDMARRGIQLFRNGPQHAIEYESLWHASNVHSLSAWLRSSVKPTEGTTKPTLLRLLRSLLTTTNHRMSLLESTNVAESLTERPASPPQGPSSESLAVWSQTAHAELQDQLDLAFTGRRWRKLGWWKLFWRVDDVAMLTNEMLAQRFLPTAEQELVYLAGHVAAQLPAPPVFPQPASAAAGLGNQASETRDGKNLLGSGELAPVVFPTTASGLAKWPGHIAFTRRYLQNETVPALQALAQKLVMQSIGTSAVTTSLAALLYASSFASTIYEAGAVAALGAMYSLARMQKKWETARGFWEGEVREEGRKAVRGAEESVHSALHGESAQPGIVVEAEKKIRRQALLDEIQVKLQELVAEAESPAGRR